MSSIQPRRWPASSVSPGYLKTDGRVRPAIVTATASPAPAVLASLSQSHHNDFGDCSRPPRRRADVRSCAFETVKATSQTDVKQTSRIAVLDDAIGRIVCLQGLHREGPESERKLSFHRRREIGAARYPRRIQGETRRPSHGSRRSLQSSLCSPHLDVP
jgi:hypothetical protein